MDLELFCVKINIENVIIVTFQPLEEPMRLIDIQPILQNILNMLSTTMEIEGSIIDNEYNLLAYTENYLKYKGSEVHSPFI